MDRTHHSQQQPWLSQLKQLTGIGALVVLPPSEIFANSLLSLVYEGDGALISLLVVTTSSAGLAECCNLHICHLLYLLRNLDVW